MEQAASFSNLNDLAKCNSSFNRRLHLHCCEPAFSRDPELIISRRHVKIWESKKEREHAARAKVKGALKKKILTHDEVARVHVNCLLDGCKYTSHIGWYLVTLEC